MVGGSGIFEVLVDGQVVAKRHWLVFPSEDEIIEAVAKAIGPGPSPPP